MDRRLVRITATRTSYHEHLLGTLAIAYVEGPTEVLRLPAFDYRLGSRYVERRAVGITELRPTTFDDFRVDCFVCDDGGCEFCPKVGS